MIEASFSLVFLSFVLAVVVAIARTKPPAAVTAAIGPWGRAADTHGWAFMIPTTSPLLRWSPTLHAERGGVTVVIDTIGEGVGLRTRARACGDGVPDRPTAPWPDAAARAHHGVAELSWPGVEVDAQRLAIAVSSVAAAWGQGGATTSRRSV